MSKSALKDDNKAEWIPFRTYSPGIENALTMLSQIRRDQYEYIRGNGVPIHQVNAQEYAKLGGECKVTTTYGCTADGAIVLNDVAGRQIFPMGEIRNDVAFRAAIISHEVVHVQHHDPIDPGSKHSDWRHRYVRPEEGEAHVTGNATLLQLARVGDFTLGVWFVVVLVVAGEFLVHTPFLFLVLFLAGAGLVKLGFEKQRSFKLGGTSRLSGIA